MHFLADLDGSIFLGFFQILGATFFSHCRNIPIIGFNSYINVTFNHNNRNSYKMLLTNNVTVTAGKTFGQKIQVHRQRS